MKSTKELARELGLLRRRSKSAGPVVKRSGGNSQPYQYIVVIDFESTCWKDQKFRTQEIIEFPAVLLNTSSGECETEFHFYVQPCEQPVLSDFCKQLTGITQAQVEDGIPLSLCMKKFGHWIEKLNREKNILFNPVSNHPMKGTFLTWSDWDLGVCLQYECKRKQIMKPGYLNSWIDLRATYRNFYGRKPQGLNGALQDLGIEFAGREHSGVDDARNTARLAWRMIRDGCVLNVTKTMKDARTSSADSIPIQHLLQRCETETRLGGRRTEIKQATAGTKLKQLFKRPLSPNVSATVTAGHRSPLRKQRKTLQHKANTVQMSTTGSATSSKGVSSTVNSCAFSASSIEANTTNRKLIKTQHVMPSVTTTAAVSDERPRVVSNKPTHIVSHAPTCEVSHEPTRMVSHKPTHVMSHEPTHIVSHEPTPVVSHEPTHVVSHKPTRVSHKPTRMLSHEPTYVVSHEPTHVVSHKPTCVSHKPTRVLSHEPTYVVSHKPTCMIYHEPTYVMPSRSSKPSTVMSNRPTVSNKITTDSGTAKSETCKATFVHPNNSNSKTLRLLETAVKKPGSNSEAINDKENISPGQPVKSLSLKQAPVVEIRTPTGLYNGVLPRPATVMRTPVNRVNPGSSGRKWSSTNITPPLCLCGRRSKKRFVQSPGPNQGRCFYSCSIGRSSGMMNKKQSGCQYFKWESALSLGQTKFAPAPNRNAMSTGLIRRQVNKVQPGENLTRSCNVNMKKSMNHTTSAVHLR